METNKTILLRSVVSIEGQRTVGEVRDLFVDYPSRKVSHYLVVDVRKNDSSLLPSDKVIAAGDTFVTVRLNSDLLSSENGATKHLFTDGKRLVGTDVFSHTGNRLGVVSGFEFDTKDGAIAKITLDSGAVFTAEQILFFVPEYVFVQEAEGVEAPTTPEPDAVAPAPTPAPEPEPEPAPVAESKDEAPAEEDDSQPEPSVELSDEEQSLFELLTDAVTNAEVASADGSYIIAKGTVLTIGILNTALTHDMLLPLSVSVDF